MDVHNLIITLTRVLILNDAFLSLLTCVNDKSCLQFYCAVKLIKMNVAV